MITPERPKSHTYGTAARWCRKNNIQVLSSPKIMIVVGRPAMASPPSFDLLLRFFEPEDGRILIDGQDVASVTRRARARRFPW
jgi:ABC-type transport system involved in Fe-S cluster assembly fused permease/ATPase subunit